MSDLEQNLREVLAGRAGASTPPPGDWQDLIIRMSRRNQRARRMLAGGLALVLVVGPMAGFAIARAVDDSGSSGRVTAGAPVGSSSNGQLVATADGVARFTITSGYSGLQLGKLFRRQGGDNIAIRAFVSRTGGGSMCQGDGWCPPADCYPDGVITGQLSTDDAVGVANGGHYRAVTTPLKVVGNGVFGANGEGSPARWVIAQTSAEASKVRVTFEGGGSDEMTPVDGVVVLAARTDTTKPGGTIEALDASGSVLGEAKVSTSSVEGVWAPGVAVQVGPASGGAADGDAGSAATTTTLSAPVVTTVPPGTEVPPTISVVPGGAVELDAPRAECQPPPPALPAPGEQPADAATAKAEVEQAFATAYLGTGDDEAKRAAVQDSDSLKDVMAQANSGSFAQSVKDASATVTEVVFTSPTEAAVRYDINLNGATGFPARIGKALLIDGRWKVARVTICADISLAGVTCPTG